MNNKQEKSRNSHKRKVKFSDDINKRNKQKRYKLNKRRTFFFGTSILAILAFLVVVVFSPPFDLAGNIVSLPFSSDQSYYADSDGIVYSDDSSIYQLNMAGAQIWSVDSPAPNALVAASSEIVVAYTSSNIVAYDSKGTELFSREFLGTIKKVECSKTLVMVSRTTAQNTSDLTVLDKGGNEISVIDIGTKTPLSFGVDEKLNLLWLLSIDTSASTPLTSLTLYSSGKSQIGQINVTSELMTDVLINDANVYLLGSTHVTNFDYQGNILSSQLVYGWDILDYVVTSDDQLALLLTPHKDTVETSKDRTLARVVLYQQSDSLISLPNNTFDAFIRDENIYCFTPDSLVRCDLSGNILNEYEFGFTIDDVGDIINDNYIIVYSADKCYLSTLP